MKYEKMVASEHHDYYLESKHIKYNEQVAEMLWNLLKQSKYTKEGLAERLDITERQLMNVMSGDKTINIYDMVHVAGALGYKWEFNLVEDSDNEWF